jgi:tetratricopeptide (TPR) repeat protein
MERSHLEIFILVWLHHNDEPVEQQMKDLKSVINSIEMFVDIDACVNFITNTLDEKIFVILASSVSEYLVPILKGLPQVYTICCLMDKNNPVQQQQWPLYRKVEGLFPDISSICNVLTQRRRKFEDSLLSFFALSTEDRTTRSNSYADKQDVKFMYAVLIKMIILQKEESGKLNYLIDFSRTYPERPVSIRFKEDILPGIEDDNNEAMLITCRSHYANNSAQLELIEEFQRDYCRDKAIWWYTRDSFLYRMINKSLSILDIETLYEMRMIIRDIYYEIEKRWVEEQENSSLQWLYRGQKMSTKEFEKLKSNSGGLFSISNFFSTTEYKELAIIYAGVSVDDEVAVLFEIELKSCHAHNNPYANIGNVSHFGDGEREWLFSMCSVFRIEEVHGSNDGLSSVHLTLTSSYDEDLSMLTTFMAREIGLDGLHSLTASAMLLSKMGEYTKAVKLYEKVLTTKIVWKTRSVILNNLGTLYNHLGLKDKAREAYEQSLELTKVHLPEDDPELSSIYNNLGFLYESQGLLDLALDRYQHALKLNMADSHIDQQTVATEYNNLGNFLIGLRRFDEADEYYRKALQIEINNLPPTHPHIATTYNNIGTLLFERRQFEKAQSMFEQCLQLKHASVPSDHPELALTHYMIAANLRGIGRFNDAQESCQKALSISIKAFGVEHSQTKKCQTMLDRIEWELALISVFDLVPSHLEQGNVTEALNLCDKCLALRPESISPLDSSLSHVYLWKSTCLKELGKYEESIEFALTAMVANNESIVLDTSTNLQVEASSNVNSSKTVES